MALFTYTGPPERDWPDIGACPAPGEVWDWPDRLDAAGNPVKDWNPDLNCWEPAPKNAKVTHRTHPTDEQSPETPAASADDSKE